MVRRTLTVPKAAFAGVILEISFARLRASMAAFKIERAPSRLFGRWGFIAIVGTCGGWEQTTWAESANPNADERSCCCAHRLVQTAPSDVIHGLSLLRAIGQKCSVTKLQLYINLDSTRSVDNDAWASECLKQAVPMSAGPDDILWRDHFDTRTPRRDRHRLTPTHSPKTVRWLASYLEHLDHP